MDEKETEEIQQTITQFFCADSEQELEQKSTATESNHSMEDFEVIREDSFETPGENVHDSMDVDIDMDMETNMDVDNVSSGKVAAGKCKPGSKPKGYFSRRRVKEFSELPEISDIVKCR